MMDKSKRLTAIDEIACWDYIWDGVFQRTTIKLIDWIKKEIRRNLIYYSQGILIQFAVLTNRLLFVLSRALVIYIILINDYSIV